MDSNIQLSFGSGCKSNAVTKSPIKTWDEWVKTLSVHRVGKKDGVWALCGFCDGKRATENLPECSMFVIDADSSNDGSVVGAPSVEVAVEALTKLGIEALLTTTHSHLRDGKGARYRIWIPTNRPYIKSELAALSAGVHSALNALGCDIKEVDESHRYCQLWYTPRHEKDSAFQVERIEGGAMLDVDNFIVASASGDDGACTGEAEPDWLSGHVAVSGVDSVVDDAGRTIAEKFCDLADGRALLEAGGYVMQGEGRWLRPNSSTGLAGCVEYHDEKRGRTVWKEFGGGGVLATGLIHDAFDLMRLFECGGDMDSAMTRAAGVVAAATPPNTVGAGTAGLATMALRTNGVIGKGGAVKRNERNASVIIENGKMFRTASGRPVFGYDTFSRKVMVDEEFVKQIHPLGSSVVEYPQVILHATMLIDEAVSEFEVQHYGKTGGATWQVKMIESVVEYVAKQNTFDPLREWIAALPTWDGVGRVETFMHQMLGVKDDEYHRACMRKFLCGAIARGMEGGVDFQLVPVLIGRQGLGKSPVMSVLFGQNWYSDAHLEISKPLEVMAAMSGKWVLEAAEQLNRGVVSNEAYKAFVSSRADRVRRMYAKDEIIVPRRCVFYSTSNNIDSGVITDRTGGKRLLPMHCHKQMTDADFAWLESNRLQIFAEAKAMYNNGRGEKLYMDGLDGERAREVQQSEMVQAACHDDVEQFLMVEDGDDSRRIGNVGVGLVDAHDRRAQHAGWTCVGEVYNHLVDCGVVEGVMSEKDNKMIEDTLIRLGHHKLGKGQTGYMKRFLGLGSKRAWFCAAEYAKLTGEV